MDERVCCYYFWKVWQECEGEDSILALGNNVASGAKLQVGKQKENQRVIANYACGSMGNDLRVPPADRWFVQQETVLL